MNGAVDRSQRALLDLMVRPPQGAGTSELTTWIDTAFAGELVVPRDTIERLGLSQSSTITATLDDGSEVVLDSFSCVVGRFGEQRVVEVIEGEGSYSLLGVGLLRDRRLAIDYRSGKLVVE